MMDAISFVLGIRSSHLRSAHLRDLIYRGRILNNESDEPTQADPTSAYVMVIYECDDKSLLRLKRRYVM